MLIASYLLGALNVLSMALAFSGRRVMAAVVSLVIQVPWVIYDITTGQPGFLLITAGSITVCTVTLARKRRTDVTAVDGRSGR